MKKCADEVIEKEHGPTAEPVDEETASSVSDKCRDRLDEQEDENLSELETALHQDLRQHEYDAVRRPQEAERHDPQQDGASPALRSEQFEHSNAAFFDACRNGDRRRQWLSS